MPLHVEILYNEYNYVRPRFAGWRRLLAMLGARDARGRRSYLEWPLRRRDRRYGGAN